MYHTTDGMVISFVTLYELLKPESIIPDNALNIIEKYTADIHQIFGNTLYNLQDHYIQQINKNTKS
jgi:hypothetical protein